MPTATLPDTTSYRRFTGNGDGELDHPVDAMGYARWTLPGEPSVITRSEHADGPIGFRGHAAVFDTPALIGGKRFGFLEQIASGAFRKTIGEVGGREDDIRLLENHDPSLLLARNHANNLRLAEDNVGLDVDADMVPTTVARNLALLLEVPEGAERATVDQMSFSFEPLAWTRAEVVDDEGVDRELITLTEVRLFDVSIVTYPAYATTDAGLRSAAFLAMARELDTDPQDLLREFSRGRPLLQDLRPVSREGTDGSDESEPSDEGTRDESQPAETTDTPISNPLRLRTLRSRTAHFERNL